LALLFLSACGLHEGLSPTLQSTHAVSRAEHGMPLARRRSVSGGLITHVVWIIQENRSFNFLFMGYPGATTQNYGYDRSGKKIMLHKQSISNDWDIDHTVAAFLSAYDNGKLDGWNKEYSCCKVPKDPAYAYGLPSETEAYWNIAEQYVLADQYFQSNIDGSFPAHQYAIAGYANHEADTPSGDWSCEGGPSDKLPTLTAKRTLGRSVPVCEDYQTFGDELDQNALSWRSYTGAVDQSGSYWNAYSAINHIYNGPDYTNDVISPPSRFITDIGNGELSAITWITPTWADSDHDGVESKGGPAWVSSLVDAIGKSPFWDSTAIFIIWDDWGGWFDPVPPIYVDYDGLGFRVPMIAVSPYAKKGYVSHVQYETASVLRFMEDNFGLSPIGTADARATDPAADIFDFKQPPRKFKAFKVKAPEDAERWDGRLPPPVGGD
jgi:phospholipase C